jgi:hypothetical protein
VEIGVDEEQLGGLAGHTLQGVEGVDVAEVLPDLLVVVLSPFVYCD